MDASHTETTTGRAVLADADLTVRSAMRGLVMQALDMDVVAEADDVPALERQVLRCKPDLVVVAWKLLAPAATALLRTLRDSSDARIVVLGLRPEMRREALAAGADAYVSMVDPPDTVTRVLRGGQYKHTIEPGGAS